eukprot:5595113-Alexandrium_andersonii.AAC.1
MWLGGRRSAGKGRVRSQAGRPPLSLKLGLAVSQNEDLRATQATTSVSHGIVGVSGLRTVGKAGQGRAGQGRA